MRMLTDRKGDLLIIQILLDKEHRFVSGFTLRTPDQLEEWMNDLRLHLERHSAAAKGIPSFLQR